MVAWSLKCNIWSYIVINLNIFWRNCEKSISHVQHTIFISAGIPFHTLVTEVYAISSIHHYFIFL